ncbi:putative amino-acid permease C11D3.08c [Mycena venus]|uniref:Putative amino-acid permease C11D3.08c n=1 Tax=Mycena venus TaxID=2733690 RepID=A0A8H7CR00_9AGAR|nr:putative amino-acid permease C11D3.08c [Mycena venus]
MSESGHRTGYEGKGNNDIVLLARLGYKQELKREFTPVELFGFGFSVSAIVPSVASVLFYSLPNGGSSAMIWGVQWATSSVFLMFIALAMAELGSAAPTSGGLYYWTYKYSSPRFRNLLSWMVGYINTISYITGVAGIDWSCATLIMAAASIGSDGSFIPTIHQTFAVYCGVVVVHGFIASCATKVIARLQYTFISINVALILVMIIGLPAATSTDLRNSAKYAFGNFENSGFSPASAIHPMIKSGSNSLAQWLCFHFKFPGSIVVHRLVFTVRKGGISCSLVSNQGGFDVGVHISEEARNASIAVPWAIVSVTGIGCLLGFAVQISVAFCMGKDTITILSSPVQQPMATILLNSFGKTGMLVIWAFIFIALFMSGVSLLTSSSRQTFAFSRDGALPFAGFLYRINPYTGTPVRCVWFSATCAMLLGLITFAGSQATAALFTLGVVGQYMANSIPIAARYLGGQKFQRGPFHLGLFSMPVAVVAVLWMWFMTVVLMFPTAPDPVAQTMNYTVVVMGGVSLLALGYYYFPKYGGAHWFKGPVSNVEFDHGSVTTEEKFNDSPM